MEENITAKVEKAIFLGKQNIPWHAVEEYAKRYVGKSYIVERTNDIIQIAGDFPNEYAWSNYSKKLRGGLAKTKANAIQVLEEMIRGAYNKRWVENKDEKHYRDAIQGWYRYDVGFMMKVIGNEEHETRYNTYRGTLVIRCVNDKMYLYDLINIKKESA